MNKSAARSVVLVWFVLCLGLGLAGIYFGMRTVLPGPASHEVILSNPGEVLAINGGIPRKD